MATFTEHYSLIKPDEADYYDVSDFNENMDSIDGLIAESASAMAEISGKIGEAADTGEDTLFGKLNSGGSLIKSIQTVDLSSAAYQGSANKAINPVDPSKCIVLMQHLQDSTHHSAKVLYTLTENNISYTSTSNVSGELYLRFQIIEFY